MTLEQAHTILNRARYDKFVPVKDIMDALEATGDLSSFDRANNRAYFDYGDESRYSRSRSLEGATTQE